MRFDGPYGVDYMIEGLCKEVQKRMENEGVKGTKVTLKVKQRKEGAKPPPKFLGHGSCHNVSKSLDAARPTRLYSELSHLCKRMFLDLNIPKEDVRGMGVIVSKLHVDNNGSSNGIQTFFRKKETLQSHDISERQEATRIRSPLVDNCTEEPLNRNKRGQNESTADPGPVGMGIVDSDDEEGEDSRDGEIEILNLSQSSASSAGLEDSGRKSARHSLDSSHENGFIIGSNSRRRSIDSNITHFGTPSQGEIQPYDSFCDLETKPRQNKPPELSQEPENDIALPALSQIHMSQVAALPSPMRRHVQEKIEKLRKVYEDSPESLPMTAPKEMAYPPPTRYRQTNVLRMMRLAAVKSGKASGEAAADISLTQLDQLPMEVQLQVVNNDTLSLGVQTPAKKVPNRNMASKIVARQLVDNKQSRPVERSAKTTQLIKRNNARAVVSTEKPVTEEDAQFTPPLDESSFFCQNILPLSVFLDANDVTEETLGLVQEFLQQFVTDYSWHEVVLLLRSVRHRGDDWSNPAVFAAMLGQVNALFLQETGDNLDIN